MIWTGLLFGLLSSLHCIGMCGPIALALPVPAGISRAWGIAAYNTGRVLMYSLLGVLLGTAGQLMVWAGWQQALSIASGLVMVAMVLLPMAGVYPERYLSFFPAAQKNAWQSLTRNTWKDHPLLSLLGAGLLNGLLPCGMVYMALAGAAAMGSAWNGSLYMALFGLGTVPAMFAISYLKSMAFFSKSIKKYIPVFTVLVGMLLILRGMNLGIPYISPEVKEHSVTCCEQHCHE